MSVTPSAAPTGSRRFWLTVLIFALANLGVWIAYHKLQTPAAGPRRDLLRVESFEPEGEGGSPVRLAWTFNMDMVAQDKVAPLPAAATLTAASEPGTATAPAQTAEVPAPGMIHPAVAGRWEWGDTRTLRFIPDKPLPPATPFKATLLKERLVSQDGFVLADPYVTSFNTQALALVSARQVSFDEQDRLVLELTFSDKVLTADVLKHLEILGPPVGDASVGKLVKYQPYGENQGSVFRVVTDSVAALRESGTKESFVTIKLAKGMVGTSGPLGNEEEISQRVEVAGVLMATEATARYPRGDDQARLYVRFNSPVEAEKIREVVSVEPAVKFGVGTSWHETGVTLTGPFEAGTRYAVKIGRPKVEGNQGYPRPTTLSVFVPDKAPEITLKHDRGYLGSAGNRTLLAKAINVPAITVRIDRLYENNLVGWCTQGQSFNYVAEPLVTKRVVLPVQKNKAQEVRLKIDELLGEARARDGVYRVGLSPEETADPQLRLSDEEEAGHWHDYSSYDGEAQAVVTLSDIGLTAKRTHEGLVAWAVSLSTAKPIEGARIRVFSSKNQPLGEARTDAEGLARLGSIAPKKGESASVVLADLGGDEKTPKGLTWLELKDSGSWDLSDTATSGRPYFRKGFEAFVYTDRGVYRPGETVVLRAIVRGLDGATPEAFPVRWQLRRPDGRAWKDLVLPVDADGGAAWKVTMPADVPVGRWSATLGLPGETGKVFGGESFLVEEFMPERLKMALALGDGEKGAKKEGWRLEILKRPLLAGVQADYLFGQPGAKLPASVVVRVDPSRFSSAKWAGYAFGDQANVAGTFGAARPESKRIAPEETALDDKGHTEFEINLKEDLGLADQPAKVRAPRGRRGRQTIAPATAPAADRGAWAFHGPWRVAVTATVSEIGGRSITASQALEADEVPFYVGLRTGASAAPKVPFSVAVALVTPDGEAAKVKAKLAGTLYKEVWNNSLEYEHGRYTYHSTRELKEVGGAGVTRISDGGADEGVGTTTCTVNVAEPGSYVLVVRDGNTGTYAAMSFYASSDQGGWADNISRENPEKLEVKLLAGDERAEEAGAAEGEQAKYKVGQKVRALVRSPFAGRLLLTLETDEVLLTRVVEMTGSSTEVAFEVPEGCRPNGYVSASVIRAVDPNAAWRTHRAYGVANLAVDNSDRKLALEVVAPAELRPNRTLDVRVVVKDAEGNPVRNAAVTVAAVDEGICQVTRFGTPDPLAFFGAKRALGITTGDMYSLLMPEVAKPAGESLVGGGDEGETDMGRHRSSVSARRVRPVALVSDVLHANEEGVAEAHLAVPEFLGQLRVMTVAHAGKRFGSAAKPVLVKSPLVVQSSWPRFAAPGDRFIAPVVVFNNTGVAGEPKVTVEVAGEDGKPSPLVFKATPEAKTTLAMGSIPAGGQAAFPLVVLADQRIGVAKVRVTATLGDESFTESVELPVRPANPMVTTGDYLTAKAGEPLKLAMAGELLPGTEKLDVRITPRPALKLPSGLAYLDGYPYGCLEQTTSTLFPLVYLHDIGEQIAPGLFDKQRVAEKVQVGITRLIGMQTADGGLAMWQGSREAWPWATVYAAHFLVEAQTAGHAVPEDFRARVLGYVRNQLDKPLDQAESVELQAYAAYVLALAGKPERAAMNRLGEVIAEREKANRLYAGESSARFFLAAAWLTSGRRDLATGILPQSLPIPRSNRELGGNLGSPVRDQALVLSTLLAVAPEHKEIPGLAERLAGSAGPRGWYSTQDTAFAVMALGRYLRAIKAEVPYESVELVAGGKAMATAEDGKPLVWTGTRAGLGEAQVKIAGKANAKAYVAWALTGVPTAVQPDADHGVKVRRSYLDDAGKPLTVLRAGQLVHVELTVDAPGALDNFVIEDLLPAGLEAENVRLASSAANTEEARTPDNNAGTQPVRPANFDERRHEVRDDRVVVIGTAPAGRSRWVYLARAVTTGLYVVPPVRGECMYDLGTNSLSGGGQTITVEMRDTEAGKPPVAQAP